MRKHYNSIIMNSDRIQELNDDTFRIKITLQLRSYHVMDILFDRNNFEIISDYFRVFVEHYGNTGNIVEATFDQLLNPDYNLPSYVVNKIGNYVFSL